MLTAALYGSPFCLSVYSVLCILSPKVLAPTHAAAAVTLVIMVSACQAASRVCRATADVSPEREGARERACSQTIVIIFSCIIVVLSFSLAHPPPHKHSKEENEQKPGHTHSPSTPSLPRFSRRSCENAYLRLRGGRERRRMRELLQKREREARSRSS